MHIEQEERCFIRINLEYEFKTGKTGSIWSDGEAYLSELRYFLEFLHGNHFTRALLAMIDSDASVDFGQWVADVEQKRILYFPDTEVGAGKNLLWLPQRGGGRRKFSRFAVLGKDLQQKYEV